MTAGFRAGRPGIRRIPGSLGVNSQLRGNGMRTRGYGITLGSLLVALLLTAGSGDASAQSRGRPGEREVKPRQPSAFRLFGERDFAVSDLRVVGGFAGCAFNDGNIMTFQQCFSNPGAPPGIVGDNDGVDLFDGEFYAAAPPSEWNKHRAVVPTLNNALGKGYTIVGSPSMLSITPNDLAALDGSLGTFHAGAQSTSDGTCLDHTETFGSGNPLLAGSDCPPTWGGAGWQGSRNVDQDGYAAWKADVGDLAFRFDPWLVPDSLKRLDKFLGNFQTYGFFHDYSADALLGSSVNPMAYNNVTPVGDQAKAPTRPGWPLGIQWKFDAFTFQAPALANIIFYQVTATNRSGEVYGVGLDYDSLYMGLTPGYLTNGELQGTSIYHSPAEGTVRWANHCTSEDGPIGCGAGSKQAPAGGDPFHPGDQWGSCPPGGAACGFTYGAGAFVILKSPIGDLRNKLFTRTGSPFEGVGDPQIWDDTITFNHGRQCGFHSCSRNTWDRDPGTPAPASTDYEQRQFGLVASITRDALGDRIATDPASLSGHIAWDTWRWENYPDRTKLDFNKWVPGGWDYNNDGTPDTLYLSSCTQNAFGGVGGCVEKWSDTLPGGFGNVYCNEGCVIGAGPFPLKADSSAQFVYAMVMAEDSVGIEAGIAAAIDHYLSFYLGPEPPPPPAIVSVEATPGGVFSVPRGAGAAEVRLYLDDAAERWEDPFLAKFRTDLLAAPEGTDLGRIRRLNPFLADTLDVLIRNNVAQIHVFKSCDAGTTFTDDADCNGDPASGQPFGPLGWLPYRSLRVGVDGTHEHVVADAEVIGGRSYLYSIVAQSRGATFAVATADEIEVSAIDGTDTTWVCTAGCGARILEVAPSLLRSISRSTTESFVTSVTVPVSHQAGSGGERAARIIAVGNSPDFVPFDRLGLRLTAESVRDGRYRALFGDTVVVEEFATQTATGYETDSTRVTVVDDGAGVEVTLLRVSPAPVAVKGAPFVESVVGSTRTRTTTFEALTAVVATSGGVPLLASSVLDGAGTVPGTFYGLPDFPRFTLAISNQVARQFDRQSVFSAGEEVGPLVRPSVEWRSGQASLDGDGGTYAFLFEDDPFGPGSPFTLNFQDPDATRQAIFNSIDQRRVARTSSVDPALLGLLGLDASQVVAARLPFTVVNLTTGTPRPVEVVVFRRATNEILVGTALDTLFAPAPADAWLPNDKIALVDANPTRIAFSAAVLACDPTAWLRATCNPVRLGTRGAGTGYVPFRAGQSLRVFYHLPLTSQSGFTFDIQSRVRGAALLTERDAIRAALDSVKVVPNPFLLFSQYAVQRGAEIEPRILFTHVPPRGNLRIFSVAGQFVQEIRWEPENLNGRGDLGFNLRTREGNVMAAGLYLYVLTALDASGGEIGRTIGKFVIIQ